MSNIKEIQLPNGQVLSIGGGTTPLFTPLFLDYKIDSKEYIWADGNEWHTSSKYPSAYSHLLGDLQNATDATEIIGSVTINFKVAVDGHRICLPDQEQNLINLFDEVGVSYFYMLGESENSFKVPRTKFGFMGYRGTVGGYVDAGLPSLPDHTHTRGTMNITGNISASGSSYGSVLGNASGAFYMNSNGIGRYTSPTAKGIDGGVTLNAADSWTGSTSGASVLSGGVYGKNTTVQPPATQMYLYYTA